MRSRILAGSFDGWIDRVGDAEEDKILWACEVTFSVFSPTKRPSEQSVLRLCIFHVEPSFNTAPVVARVNVREAVKSC
jgi:hypothetical protein